MEEKEHKNFLRQIANEVDKLIQNAAFKKIFGSQIKAGFRVHEQDKDLFGHHFISLIEGAVSEPPLLSDDEKSMLEYFSLAVIHDWDLIDSNNPTARLICFENPANKYSELNEIAHGSWELLRDFSHVQEYQMGDQIRSNITRALEHVKVDLAEKHSRHEKPAETEEKATLAKSERESWLWKLYEKTLKVIFDAVLERMWPK